MVRSHIMAACVWVAALVAVPGTAAAMRCSGRIVDSGDYAVQVRARCGAPYWVRDRQSVVLGESVSVRVDLGCSRTMQKQLQSTNTRILMLRARTTLCTAMLLIY